MRRIAVVATVFAAACRGQSSPPTSDPAGTSREDSVAVVRAAWRAATADGHSNRVQWLWVPETATADSARVVPFSAAVRDALVRQGLRASDRRPMGDDTVVFRVQRWEADSSGVLVDLESRWTTVMGVGARRCRGGSANLEPFRVRRQGVEWIAERAGPVTHGDNMCLPIP